MSLKNDAMIVGGIAIAVVAAGWYAKRQIGNLGTDALNYVAASWDSLGTATNDTLFGIGNSVNSVIPLYSQKTQEQELAALAFNDRRYETAMGRGLEGLNHEWWRFWVPEAGPPANYDPGNINDGSIF